jgi:hypothetical protein
MRETPEKGNARPGPRRATAASGSAPSMKTEALAFYLRREPFLLGRGRRQALNRKQRS